jgi:hypothetical protein
MVGLVPVEADDRQTERVQCPYDQGYLDRKLVRCLLDGGASRGGHLLDPGHARFGHSVRLIAGDEVHPPLGPPVVVPTASQVGGGVGVDQPGDEIQ